MREIASPLPADPIGEGATWVRASAATPKESYTLTELSGDQATVEITLTQQSPAPPPPHGWLPESMNARGESATMVGNGSSSFDLNRIVPTKQAWDATSTTVYATEQHGDVQHITVTLHATVKMSGTKP
jgi:hypothetical protein